MFFDHDRDSVLYGAPKSENAIIEEWLDIIELGLSIAAKQTDPTPTTLVTELEQARAALARSRTKRRG